MSFYFLVELGMVMKSNMVSNFWVNRIPDRGGIFDETVSPVKNCVLNFKGVLLEISALIFIIS